MELGLHAPEWNQMSMSEYLVTAYNYVVDGLKPKKIVVIQSCCGHYMKRTSTIIKRNFAKYVSIKSFLTECVVMMMLSRNIEKLDNIFVHFVKAISTPDAQDAEASLLALGRVCTEQKVEIAGIVNIDGGDKDHKDGQQPTMDTKTKTKSKTLYQNSPFCVRYGELLRATLGIGLVN